MKNKLFWAITTAFMSMSVHPAPDDGSQIPNELQQAIQLTSPVTLPTKKYALTKNSKVVSHHGVPSGSSEKFIYLIQLEDNPVALMNEPKGILFKQTRHSLPASKRPIGDDRNIVDIHSTQAQSYKSQLLKKQSIVETKLQATVAQYKRLADFQYAINGFAVLATPAEAEKMATIKGVRNVERDRLYKLDTDTGPLLIGSQPVWNGTATESGVGREGEGVVIGVLDSGINSDHPSFADVGGDGYNHTNPLGAGNYLGDCAGEFSALCNDKLIGIYSYPEITSVYDDSDVFSVSLPKNGEDYNGHGSHTAATAAGNVLLNVPEVTPELGSNESDGEPTGFVFDRISGVAPHANIISYQVCQPGNTGDTYGGCLGTPMVAAVEDAIESGIVDVINFSISGGGYPWTGALNAAWLSARNAGIFLAHSAGNEGPTPFSTAKHAPWVTAVGAASTGRSVEYVKYLTDFTGGNTSLSPIEGRSNTGGITASIVYAGDYPNINAPGTDPAQCLEPFPPGTFSGEIVVCERGEIARVDKAINVAEGGASGFVLVNVENGQTSLNNDAYVIPGIHINESEGNRLLSWLSTGSGHQATITASEGELVIDEQLADITADFSSRGPNRSISTLTPALTAPGIDIYAAYADQQYGQDETGSAPADYAYLSGTSMASPHVAGAAALIKQEHPDWSPDNIRSALMMTASTALLKEDGTSDADWFDIGAGRIQVDLAVRSGLVMDETGANYAAADPELGGEPRTLNLPSVTDTECFGICSWTRTFTATKDGSWLVSSASLSENLNLSVSPTQFTLSEGETQVLTITADASQAKSGVWRFGIVEMVSPTSPDLHIPVSVKPSNGTLPETLNFTSHRDHDSYLVRDLSTIEITDFQVTGYGLNPPNDTTASIGQDSDNSDFLDDLTDGIYIQNISVPAGALRLVVETRNSSAPDLDLFVVFDANNDGRPSEAEVVEFSQSSTSDEYISIESPQQGDYLIIVQNWRASSDTAIDDFTLSTSIVENIPTTKLSATAPSSVDRFELFDMRVLWDLENSERGKRYSGMLILGTDSNNPSILGAIPVDIIRGKDDVFIAGEASNSDTDDTQQITLNVMANFTPEDRRYVVTLPLPSDVQVESALGSGDVRIEGSTLEWRLTQPSLFGLEPTYRMTTNATDPNCKNPDLGTGTGYIDLKEFDIEPTEMDGDTVLNSYAVSASLFGRQYNSLTVSDDGFVSVNSDVGSEPWINQLMPNAIAPNGVVAPFWRDWLLDIQNGATVSIAESQQDGVTVIEWDNVTFPFELYNIEDTFADVADFQIVFNNNASSNEPQIIFSYANVIHDYVPPASVGLENSTGSRGNTLVHLPYFEQGQNEVGSVESQIVNGRQICFYYTDDITKPASLKLTLAGTGVSEHPSYQARSEVTNIPGTQAENTNTFSLASVNQPPVLTVNAPNTVTVGQSFTVSASATDPDGDPLSFTINGIAGNSLTRVAPNQANMTFTVIVTDGVNSVSQTVTVTIISRSSGGNSSGGGGGSVSWLILLVLPLLYRRNFH
ncbi:S8 family serine peptidase [Alteromonas sp. ASW11-130]|uniref:S8 family serine peptidase n=1 Tax=Alteromonas sp. ASW11-130 TaxID=3015775 RepID=UPI002241FCB5|nr:S8 family serine peptidase [Alteromonas sp. ASW11-130]MCW8092278.1 S8 family serine peptidase [Alteromonas sp. ASW11-130]